MMMANPNLQAAVMNQFNQMSMNPPVKKTLDPNLTLYVGNLPDNTFDNDLFKNFNSKNYKVAKAKVIIDRNSSKSKNFGFLTFFTPEEAQRCHDAEQNSQYGGKQLIVSKWKKDKDYDDKSNVFVKGLPKDMAQNQMHDLFKPFGAIESCKLEMDSNGTSRGYGFVQFEKIESANQAIQALNGTTQGGSELTVTKHVKRSEKEETPDFYTNLHIKNIPTGFTEANLRDLFKEFGDVRSVKIKEDGSEQGFCQMSRHEDAKRALEALNAKKEINGKFLFVSKHISRSENTAGGKVPPITQQMKETFKSNVYVRFIPKSVTEKEFMDKMSKCGKIISMKL